MKPFLVRMPTSMFLAVVVAVAGLYYRSISTRAARLEELRSQEQRDQAQPTSGQLAVRVESLRSLLATQQACLSPDASGTTFLGHLTRIMQELGMQDPVIRAGQAQTRDGVVQSTIDVECGGSLGAMLSLLHQLSEASPSWRLSHFNVSRPAGRSAEHLSVGLRLVRFARATGDSSP